MPNRIGEDEVEKPLEEIGLVEMWTKDDAVAGVVLKILVALAIIGGLVLIMAQGLLPVPWMIALLVCLAGSVTLYVWRRCSAKPSTFATREAAGFSDASE